MPTLKTHKGANKRVKVTKNRKVVRKNSRTGHLMSRKTGRQRRHLSGFSTCEKADNERMLRLLGLK